MNAIIRQENRKKYLLIEREHSENDYKERMLKNNNIPGILKLQTENFNGEEFWSFEIGSMRSIADVFDGGKLRYPELKSFFRGYAELQKSQDGHGDHGVCRAAFKRCFSLRRDAFLCCALCRVRRIRLRLADVYFNFFILRAAHQRRTCGI